MDPSEPRPITWMERIGGVCRYLKKERGWFLFVAFVIFVVAAMISSLWDWLGGWLGDWDIWDQMITLSTLIVGIAVFLNEAIGNWEARLPKRLNVFFQANGQTCMVCYGAHLAHEGDLRSLSQQIGRQMGKTNLELCPRINLKRLGIQRSDGVVFVQFQAVIFLKTIPTPKANNARDENDAAEDNIPLKQRLRAYADAHDGQAGCVVLRVGNDCELPEVVEPAERHQPRLD